MAYLKLETPLIQIKGIGLKFLKRFEKLGIHTVRDLLWHFPTRYEDFSQIYPIADLEPGQQATIQAVVQEISIRRSFRKKMVIVEALVADETGSVRAIWFNQPFVRNILREGRLANFAGKVSLSDNELYLSSPTYELIGNHETTHTGRLVPVYPETRGLTSKGIRFVVKPLLKSLERIQEWIPKDILRSESFPEIQTALFDIHFPEKIEDALKAKNRFAFENLFLLQLFNLQQKLKLTKENAPGITTDIENFKKILEALPFTLTVSQKQSLWEIIQDLEKPTPMNRLLQGDVGSGKTVVAALAALSVAEHGYQSAFMAPTEVLAHQHFVTLKKLFKNVSRENQVPIGLLTSASAKAVYENDVEADMKKKTLLEHIKRGEIKIVIGTHALIQKSVAFKNLGLVIVDEQHRFGVEQRAVLLRQQGTDERSKEAFGGAESLVLIRQPAERVSAPRSRRVAAAGADKTPVLRNAHLQTIPHFLSMSATPIPRTLMLTVFGDLDISTINELPSGRRNIITKIVDPENRMKAYAFIRGEVQKGRQAFVICPRIEKEESLKTAAYGTNNFKKLELKSVKEEYEKLSQKIFPDLRVAMLHGQLKPKEKEKIMDDFKNRKTDILVSTSVIEVGVDIPNATVMMIEGSDRFGLAQLYQFRGRVGRGEHQSYCLLFTDSPLKKTNERLKAILEAKNGFELAEKDLEIRGPGQFLGKEQTGLPDLAMRGLQNIELIKSSRDSAIGIIKKDPTLKRHPLLKEKLFQFQKTIHLE